MSLKTLWLKTLPDADLYRVNPREFGKILQSTLDFLITYQLPATLWVKLPRKQVWWTELRHYALYQPSSKIYSLSTADFMTAIPPLSNWQALPLPHQISLPGEYLLLISSPHFTCTLVALRQPAADHESVLPTSALPKPELLISCSLAPQIIWAFKPVIRTLVQMAADEQRVPASTAMLRSWDQVFPAAAAVDSRLIDAFLNWHLQAMIHCYRRHRPENRQRSLPFTQ
jgi:hypothetical protein